MNKNVFLWIGSSGFTLDNYCKTTLLLKQREAQLRVRDQHLECAKRETDPGGNDSGKENTQDIRNYKNDLDQAVIQQKDKP